MAIQRAEVLLMDWDHSSESLRGAAIQILERIASKYPDVIAETIEGTTPPFVVLKLFSPAAADLPIVATVFYNGSYQIEVFGLLDMEEDTPAALEQTVDSVTSAVIHVASTGIPGTFKRRGFAPWEPSAIH